MSDRVRNFVVGFAGVAAGIAVAFGGIWLHAKIDGSFNDETTIPKQVEPEFRAVYGEDGKRIDQPDMEEIFCRVPNGTFRGLLIPPAGYPEIRRIIVVSTEGTPTPAPKPVDPKPIPVPIPEPEPIVDDAASVKVPGFRAMMLYESENKDIASAFFDKSVRDYLNAKCVKGDDGKTPDWRCWDADLDPEGDFPVMVAYRKAAKVDSLPWLHCGNGVTAYNGPAPTTATELLAILKRYGG